LAALLSLFKATKAAALCARRTDFVQNSRGGQARKPSATHQQQVNQVVGVILAEASIVVPRLDFNRSRARREKSRNPKKMLATVKMREA
jgi:hypothetical protein